MKWIPKVGDIVYAKNYGNTLCQIKEVLYMQPNLSASINIRPIPRHDVVPFPGARYYVLHRDVHLHLLLTVRARLTDKDKVCHNES